MPASSHIDFDLVWKEILAQFKCNPHSVHGPGHWRRVELNGLRIAAANGASINVVRLFAILHDSCRVDDRFEFEHGERAADYAAILRSSLFSLDDREFDLLVFACRRHTHGELSDDATIGACWDADRLDLPRVGITPDPSYMSTEAGKKIAISLGLSFA